MPAGAQPRPQLAKPVDVRNATASRASVPIHSGPARTALERGRVVQWRERYVLSGGGHHHHPLVVGEVLPVVCPAVLCGQRRLAARLSGGDRLGAAADHITDYSEASQFI